MTLWTINRVLRWTGFRLYVDVSTFVARPSETVDRLVEAMCASTMLKYTHDEEMGLVARGDLRDRFIAVLQGVREPTKVGVTWYGLPGSEGWARIEPNNPTPIRSALGRKT